MSKETVTGKRRIPFMVFPGRISVPTSAMSRYAGRFCRMTWLRRPMGIL